MRRHLRRRLPAPAPGTHAFSPVTFRWTGVDNATWLFSTQKTAGSRRAAQSVDVDSIWVDPSMLPDVSRVPAHVATLLDALHERVAVHGLVLKDLQHQRERRRS